MPNTDEDMRLVVGKAAEAILTYALSDEFDWKGQRNILLDIIANAMELKAILDARETRDETTPSPMVQD